MVILLMFIYINETMTNLCHVVAVIIKYIQSTYKYLCYSVCFKYYSKIFMLPIHIYVESTIRDFLYQN